MSTRARPRATGKPAADDELVAEVSRTSSASAASFGSVPALVDPSETARLLLERAADQRKARSNNTKRESVAQTDTSLHLASRSIAGEQHNMQRPHDHGIELQREREKGKIKEAEEEAETMTIRLADLSKDLARDLEGLRLDISEASSLDWAAQSTKSAPAPTTSKPAQARSQLPGFALRRSEELSAEDFRLYDAFHKATGHGYMSTTELWQRRLSLGSSTGTRSDDNPEPKQSDVAAERQRRVSRSSTGSLMARSFSSKVSKLTASRKRQIDATSELERQRTSKVSTKEVEIIPASSRLTRPTVTSASREVSRFEAERLEQARRQQFEKEPTVEEERRFRKLMRKDTATTSGRKRLLHKFSSGPAFAHQDEMYPGKLDLDVGSWVSASEPGPSPDTKEQGKPYFHMVSTATEGAHTWGTTWGTRDQANAAWVGPDHDVVSPIDNSAWASRDSKCEEDDTDDGNAFLYSRPPKRTPKLSRGSKQILKSHPEQRKPILEHSKMWAARQKQRREHGDSDGFDGNAAATRPRTAGHERYAMLRRRSIVAQQAESAEAESLMSLVATLPDGFRENVVKMIDTLPTPALAASRGEKGSAKSSMPASPRCTNIDRHWAHDDLVQEHADLHGHDQGEATSSPASPSGTSRDKPHGKVAKKAVYRPDAINSHVERLCEFRKRQHQKAQAAERAFQASGWTPETTVQKPFHLSSATRKASRDRALGRTTGSSSSSSSSSSLSTSSTSETSRAAAPPKRIIVASKRRRKAKVKRSKTRTPRRASVTRKPLSSPRVSPEEDHGANDAEHEHHEGHGTGEFRSQHWTDQVQAGDNDNVLSHPQTNFIPREMPKPVDHRCCSHVHDPVRGHSPRFAESASSFQRERLPAWGRRQTEWIPQGGYPGKPSSSSRLSMSTSTPPFAKIPADERKLLDEIESEIERSILLSASERSMEESKQPDLFRSAADIDRFLEASV